MNASLDLYKIFCLVAEKNSITLASEELFISQPAVSQSLKQLEGALGCKLFTRMPKGVRLTVEGEAIYSYIRNGLDLISLGEKKLASLINLESGEIRVGASDMTLQFFLLPYLERFHMQYPDIKICVTNGPTPDTLSLLRQDKIDFGIVSEPFDGDDNITAFSVRQIQDVFVCGPKFRELTLGKQSPEVFASLPFICLEKNTSTRGYVDNFFAQRGVTITPDFELATSHLIVHFAKRNLGVGSVVRDFALDELRNGTLFEIELEKSIPPRSFCIVKGKGIISRAADRLLSMIIPSNG